MCEFDINDYDGFTSEQLLAMYHYVGHQIDNLNYEKEQLAKFRNDCMMRYHELVEYAEAHPIPKGGHDPNMDLKELARERGHTIVRVKETGKVFDLHTGEYLLTVDVTARRADADEGEG